MFEFCLYPYVAAKDSHVWYLELADFVIVREQILLSDLL